MGNMSRCLDCTECRTVNGLPSAVRCRKGIFIGIMPVEQPFLSVERKCVEFKEETIDGNTSGNKGSDI